MLSEQDGPGIVINGTSYQAEEISAVWGPRIPDPDEKREDAEDAAYSKRMAELPPDKELRDTFAAFALTGILAHGDGEECTVPTVASDAYRYADAMTEERRKRNGD